MAGLSPKLPLAPSPEDGYWGLNKTILETTKQNFKNLLLTIPGERVMDPFFGVGLLAFLFEQKGGFTEDNITAKIGEQVNTYLPHIQLLDITFSDSFENTEISPHSLVIRIVYRIIPLGDNDILEIEVDPDANSFTT